MSAYAGRRASDGAETDWRGRKMKFLEVENRDGDRRWSPFEKWGKSFPMRITWRPHVHLLDY